MKQWYLSTGTGRGHRPTEREYPATITPVVAVLRMVSQWHVDVVIVERRSFSIVAAVELDDASHFQPGTPARDILLGEGCQAGLQLLRSHDAEKTAADDRRMAEYNRGCSSAGSPEHRS